MNLLDLLENGSRSRLLFRHVAGEASTTISASDLWLRSAAVAVNLTRRTDPGATLAVLLTNRWESLAFTVGALITGSRVLSLPLPARGVSITAYADEVKRLVSTTGATAIVAEQAIGALIDRAKLRIASWSLEELADGSATGVDRASASGGELVQFSSGSTGTPKGVRLSTSTLGRHVQQLLQVLEPGSTEILVSWLPYSHDMGLIGTALGAWCAGGEPYRSSGTIVTLRPEDFVRRPSVYLEACSESRATITASPAFSLDLLTRFPLPASTNLSSLRTWILGADLIPPSVLERAAIHLGRGGLSASAFSPAYGLAEATLGVSMVLPSDSYQTVTGPDGMEYVSCGPALTDVKVRTRGSGEIGEIEVLTPSMCDGYLDGQLPLSRDGWFQTRDLGSLRADGHLVVMGRSDDVVSLAGRKFSLAAIDRVANEHISLTGARAMSAVLSNQLCVAIEVAEKYQSAPGIHSLVHLIRDRFGVSPSVRVLPHGMLPRTPSGKPQRHRLVRRLTSYPAD